MEYPITMRSINNGMVVRFSDRQKGVVISQGLSNYPVGYEADDWVAWEKEEYWQHLDPTVRPQHPLLNPESRHYEMLGGTQAIELMESMFTVEELMAWAKLTAMKYRLRIGDKDSPEKEIKKIKTFEEYYRYLEQKNVTNK